MDASLTVERHVRLQIPRLVAILLDEAIVATVEGVGFCIERIVSVGADGDEGASHPLDERRRRQLPLGMMVSVVGYMWRSWVVSAVEGRAGLLSYLDLHAPIVEHMAHGCVQRLDCACDPQLAKYLLVHAAEEDPAPAPCGFLDGGLDLLCSGGVDEDDPRKAQYAVRNASTVQAARGCVQHPCDALGRAEEELPLQEQEEDPIALPAEALELPSRPLRSADGDAPGGHTADGLRLGALVEEDKDAQRQPSGNASEGRGDDGDADASEGNKVLARRQVTAEECHRRGGQMTKVEQGVLEQADGAVQEQSAKEPPRDDVANWHSGEEEPATEDGACED
mmetsp:Transcript_35626/g.102645  ORF Transcript_35626/g.102645 Transcript_35626/m.102645 type:complete len:337 (-) Transcript_35626:533-1543(-)